MFEYIIYLFYAIKNYFSYDTIKYHLPFDINEIENDPEFNIFKNNDKDLNKVIFALNNLPENVHTILFKNNIKISNKFFYVTLKTQNQNIIEIFHNINDANDQMNNDDVQYILIRINIIDIMNNKMNHVNSIIIDKHNKYILFFEPKVTFTYNINDLTKIIDEILNVQTYTKIYPENIGYNSYNKMQQYDAFCQSYILFVFIIITLNENVKPENFSLMFNTTITTQNLGYLLFYINRLLKNDGMDICDQDEIWSFPTNTTKNLLNLMHLFFNNKDEISKYEINKLILTEEDDITIIDTIIIK